MKKLLAISLFILAISGNAMAQNNTQSRLNIGVKPKVPTTTKAISVIGVTPLKEEIELNEKDAILNFYKNLLLKPSEKKQQINTEVYSVPERSDALFTNEDVFVKNIYPNPASERAYLEYDIKNMSTKAYVSFHNLLGSTIDKFDLDSFDRKIEISTQNWDDGVYFYQLVVDGKKVATKKLLVRHN